MVDFGKGLILIGLLLVILGALFYFGVKIPGLGHLPGDIYIQRSRFTFYFPLTTCLLVSLILMLVLYLFRR
ncbi:MAG: DUF2905 domain-containing protein [Candidatus Binatia bacterium]